MVERLGNDDEPGRLGNDDEPGRLGNDDELGRLGNDDELGRLGNDEAPGPVMQTETPLVDAETDPPSPLTLSEPPPEAEPGSDEEAGRPGVDSHFVLVAGSDGVPDPEPEDGRDERPDPDPEPEDGNAGADGSPALVRQMVMPFVLESVTDPPLPEKFIAPPPDADPGSGSAGGAGVEKHFVPARLDGLGNEGADGSPALVRQMVMPFVLESVTDPPFPEKLIVPPPDADPGSGSAGGAGVEKHSVPARLDGLGNDDEPGRLGSDEAPGSAGRLGNDDEPGRLGSDDMLVSAVGLIDAVLAPLGRAPPATRAMPTAPAAPPARETAFHDFMLYLPWSP